MNKMTKLLALVMALAMVLCLAACVSENPENSDAATDPVPSSTPTEPTPTTTPTDSGKKTYTVTLKDSSGNPLAGVMVQICLDSCMPALTNADGVATFELPEESGYSVGVTSDYENSKVYLEDGQYDVTIVWDDPAAG